METTSRTTLLSPTRRRLIASQNEYEKHGSALKAPPSTVIRSFDGLHDLLRSDRWWSRAVITKTEVYIRGVHTFLILKLELSRAVYCWIRIERCAKTGTSCISAVFGAPTDDIAQHNYYKWSLVGKARRLNCQLFDSPNKPPVAELERIMRKIHGAAPTYSTLTTNCRFICALVQNHLAELYGGHFQKRRIMNNLVGCFSKTEFSRVKGALRASPALPPATLAFDDTSLIDEFNGLLQQVRKVCRDFAVEVESHLQQRELPPPSDAIFHILLSTVLSRIYNNIFWPFHPLESEDTNEAKVEEYSSRLENVVAAADIFADYGLADAPAAVEPLAQVVMCRARQFREANAMVRSEDVDKFLEDEALCIVQDACKTLGIGRKSSIIAEAFNRAAPLFDVLELAYNWNSASKSGLYNLVPHLVHQTVRPDEHTLEYFNHYSPRAKNDDGYMVIYALELAGPDTSSEDDPKSDGVMKSKVLVQPYFPVEASPNSSATLTPRSSFVGTTMQEGTAVESSFNGRHALPPNHASQFAKSSIPFPQLPDPRSTSKSTPSEQEDKFVDALSEFPLPSQQLTSATKKRGLFYHLRKRLFKRK